MLLQTTKTYLPNLVVIGAMKCGTTSLHDYLSLHPQISMSQLKELDFFVEKFNWQKGKDWYKSNFKVPTEIRGESSPNYTKCHLFEGVPERMHRLIPEAKLIYVVRDPIKRIISHYVHRVARGLEKRSIDEALADVRDNNYINTSLYFMQLERYLEYYPASSILIIPQEDLYRDRIHTLQKIFKFLNIDEQFSDPQFLQTAHESATKKQPTDLRLKLSKLPGGRVFAKAVSLMKPELVDNKISKPILSQSTYESLKEVLTEDARKLSQFSGNTF
ncbi:sulfotransferase [Oscillatoriales cyanobacterium LEGE 11467]|uniref:Sulfotransferase n=1 Tax=Zarconia navalis LEGE 11467 TaxID=1828826 RepID=A0A928Z7T4_9CYAN|nr:sulfotransferase [Zarconia navalis]MBE9040028.1 sulfotransferase [Zarconia navalis LEGE 11467]